MKHKLTGILNIVGVLILLACAPGALAASWSSTVCKVPPTYGPYCCTKYYCPAVGSVVLTTFLTGQVGSDVAKCTDGTQENCVSMTDEIDLDTSNPEIPNQLFQCFVPGSKTCKNPGKCGGSSTSEGIVMVNQTYAGSLTTALGSDSCIKDQRNKQVKCEKSQRFPGYEGDSLKAAEVCPGEAGTWQIGKWLALRLRASNWLVYSSDPNVEAYRTDLACELLDAQGLRPGDPGYMPDLVTLSNNHYECQEL